MKKYEILLALLDGKPCHPLAIRWFLEGKGYQVTPAIGSDSAIEKLHEKNFDLVITDLVTILEKSKGAHPEMMALLMLTDKSGLIPLPNFIRSLADDYLFVPFDLNELEMRVADCFNKLEVKRKPPQTEEYGLPRDGDSLNALGIFSHDFRESVLSLSATLRLLIRGHYGKVEEEIVRKLQEMLSKTACLAGMTEECLSRIFSNQGDRGTEDEMLGLAKDILHPVLEELDYELKKNQVQMNYHFDAIGNTTIPIRASRFWLKAVFRNLLKNAINYGGKGCAVGLSFEDHHSFYRFTIYNSGRPVPEEYRDRLFSGVTYRHNSSNGNGDGYGLGVGLYLTKKIIQRYGGEIWYEAKADGSNFVFTLASGVPSSIAPSLPMRSKPFPMTAPGMHGIKEYVQ
jgi:hypothetical protein